MCSADPCIFESIEVTSDLNLQEESARLSHVCEDLLPLIPKLLKNINNVYAALNAAGGLQQYELL